MRSVIAVAIAASVALATPGLGAVAKPQITDPTGDAVPPIGAGYDIVSALFRTEGTTSRVGRRTVYTPTKLVITTTYAGDIPTEEIAAQVVEFDVPGCEGVYLERYAVGATYGTAGCIEGSFGFTAKASGKTLTFTVPFAVIGKSYLKPGATLTGLRTYTAVGDPVVGYESAEIGGPTGLGAVDNAWTNATYRIG